MALPPLVSRETARQSLLSMAVLGLASTLAAQQPTSNGHTTATSSPQTRAAVTSPPLPPNSTELAYDTGIYTGHARNLQNAGIHPGWGYWAQAVRFTPTGSATGNLLEVRYVASSQWGANTEYDLLIRDDQGLVLGILHDLTATLDTANWQVVDVSGLNIQVGSQDFTVEMRPANPCGGQTGFTIAYSTPSNARSTFSDDCSDTFVGFQPESIDLFLRAVVEDGNAPGLSLTPLVAGQAATLQASGLTPLLRSWVGLSLTGAGPWLSPVGLVSLTPPVSTYPLDADANGDAVFPFQVPANMSGASVWLQVYDPATATLGQAIAAQVQ
ncbi:MAG: hypothetical protein ACPG31_02050 [Planctomycetota bacterium]